MLSSERDENVRLREELNNEKRATTVAKDRLQQVEATARVRTTELILAVGER